MSKFNKKTFKETFNSKDRILIYILSLTMLTTFLTFSSAFITNKFLLINDSSNNNSQSTNTTSYSATKEITKSTTLKSGNFKNSSSDENAILLNGNIEATLSNIEVTKNGDSNGGDVTLVMTKQTANGNIVIDSISTLDMTLKSSSNYKGTINGENTAKSIKLKLDKSSKITLTGDSYVTFLEDEDTTYSNIDFNGYKLYVNGKSIK